MKIESVQDITEAVDTSALLIRSLSDWRPVLAEECQVYVFGENYLAKRFDQINFKFCEKKEAQEVLVDNLYALLRYKYFPKTSEEVDDRINKIVNSFMANLKTTLKKVSFDKSSDANVIKLLDDNCIAFRNGVFDFKKNQWLFKYDVIDLNRISNKIYLYDPSYAILWYLDYNFEPLPIDITETPLQDFVDMMKELTKSNRNYCFELMYNIAHDANNKFNIERFEHLCEVFGYTCLQSFSQYFVLLIGSGQNGKNSLFDGCFTNRVIPRPAANDLDSIENDRFITGSLENKSHNIFLETSAKTYTESKMIKALTGSMYQTIESKGISKYSGVINCKYIFAGNDQDKIKFADTTTGFRRRINMFEIWYRWDSQKRFLKAGDYFDTTFSDSLYELKEDVANTTLFVYFAMYGIMAATKNFTKNFQFTKNDWNTKYSDIDFDTKEKIDKLTPQIIASYITSSQKAMEDAKTQFYSIDKTRLYSSSVMKQLGFDTFDKMLIMFKNIEYSNQFFADNDIYIAVSFLKAIIKNFDSPTSFTQLIKKIYSLDKLEPLNSNKPYIKCTFINNKLKVLR